MRTRPNNRGGSQRSHGRVRTGPGLVAVALLCGLAFTGHGCGMDFDAPFAESGVQQDAQAGGAAGMADAGIGGGGAGGGSSGQGGAGGATAEGGTSTGGGAHDAASEAQDASAEEAATEAAVTFSATVGDRPGATYPGTTRDASIEDLAGATFNYGAGIYISTDTDPPKVSLLRFILPPELSSAKVLNAQVSIWTATGDYFELSSGDVRVHALLESWEEGNQDGASGVANWTERLANVPWTSAGAGSGSRGPELLAFMPGTQDKEYLLTLPTDLVQGWLANPASNHGIVLVCTSPQGDGVVFHSSESPVTAKRPELRLTLQQ
jgi:hypothetical protein